MVVIARDDSMQIDKLELGPFGVNTYIITCLSTQDSVLIDTPAEAGTILEKLGGTNPKYILLTHNHMDHTGALTELHATLKVPLAIHTLDAGNIPSPPDMLLNDSDNLSVGDLKLEVLHTPGHTPGSICLYALEQKLLFVGDALQRRRKKLRLPAKMVSTDMEEAIASVKRMAELDLEILCFGHGKPLFEGTRDRLLTLIERSGG